MSQDKLNIKESELADALRKHGIHLHSAIETMSDEELLDLLDSFAFEHLAKAYPQLSAKTKLKLRASIAEILLLRDGYSYQETKKSPTNAKTKPFSYF